MWPGRERQRGHQDCGLRTGRLEPPSFEVREGELPKLSFGHEAGCPVIPVWGRVRGGQPQEP